MHMVDRDQSTTNSKVERYEATSLSQQIGSLLGWTQKPMLPNRGVARLDGAQGKKQVWRPHVRTWGLSEANVLRWSICDTVETFRRPENCAPLAPSLHPCCCTKTLVISVTIYFWYIRKRRDIATERCRFRSITIFRNHTVELLSEGEVCSRSVENQLHGLQRCHNVVRKRAGKPAWQRHCAEDNR